MLINNDVLQLIRRPVIRFETFTSLLLLAGV